MALSFSPADDLSLALAVAADADLVSMSRFRQADLDIDTKDDNTPVTDADRAVEDRIRAMIRASRPRDQILGEERGHSSGTESSREWVIDPIDGTAGFSRGLPIWATLIALTSDGVPQVGGGVSSSTRPTMVGGHRARCLDKTRWRHQKTLRELRRIS